ncbi:MAG TPA: right-handed parallel beta-helix repeat-containing protein [Rhizomicrobium sp.]|jgi:hypothetical protein|nr:right-handed parallel beta-helix repeat-containing protein [Rhizomicrobium sp.]
MSGTVGASIVSGVTTAGLIVGELVSGSGSDSTGVIQIQPGAEVASIDPAHSLVTLTLPLVGTATTPTGTPFTSVTFTGDNTGTLIVDTGGDCYQKTNYRGDPHEFGAHGDSNSTGTTGTDDTIPIEYWLGAYGNVNPNLAPGTAPPNFGPWIASIPANYLVSTPLSCPPNATIMGTENLQNGNIPRTNFVAAPGFSGFSYPYVTSATALPPLTTFYGSQAVFAASPYCRLSGVAVTGNGFDRGTTGNTHGTTTIDGLGSITGVKLGNAVAGADVSAGTVVTALGSCSPTCSVTVSQATTGGGVTGESITFYGPDAVDVLGRHVTIDGYSFLNQGRYNILCGITGFNLDALAVRDVLGDHSLSDNFHIPGPCYNTRITDDIVDHAGYSANNTVTDPNARGILFGSSEGIFANSVIEESQGIGLDLESASQLSVSGMDIQGNGQGVNGGVGIKISHAHTASICNNHLEGNGGDIHGSAQIFYDGVSDNVNVCSNVYLPQSLADVALRPDFVYDASHDAALTNSHIYDAPAPQASGRVYSLTAAAILPQLQVPHVVQNALSGLTLSNFSRVTPSQTVNIAPGEATDSTGAVNVQLTATCPVNLGATTNGAGGLDAGSVSSATTYFYFLIATASGGNPNCMASASPAPTFVYTGTTYTLSTTGNTRFSLPLLYNMGSIAGLAPGQLVQANSYIPANTTIVSVGTMTTQAAGSIASDLVTVTVPSTANLGPGMLVSDVYNFSGCSNAASKIPTKDSIASVITSTTFTLSVPVNAAATSDCIVVSSGNTVQLSNNTTGGYANGASFTIFNGVYALIAPLYTDMTSSSNVVGFAQDGNTFYLAQSVPDIVTSAMPPVCAVGSSTISCALSVPCGRNATCGASGYKVEAFGRVVGGNTDILLSSLDQYSQPAPNGFGASPPGYSTTSYTSSASHPFRVYTDATGKVRVQASGGGNTVYEDTDGWVLHR